MPGAWLGVCILADRQHVTPLSLLHQKRKGPTVSQNHQGTVVPSGMSSPLCKLLISSSGDADFCATLENWVGRGVHLLSLPHTFKRMLYLS